MGVENIIPEGWLKCTLGEICENISRRFNFKEKEDVIFVNTGDVSNGKFLHHNRVSKEGLPGQAKKAVEYGDILYSEIRPANKRFALVDFDSKDYVVSTKFMVLKKNDRVDLDFLYLFLTSNKAIATFQAHAEARSGTFPQITFDTISYDEILIPPIPEQKAIAKVLTAFDDKIELLQAQNKTLETMAQTIFKEWFGKYQVGDELPEGWSFSPLYSIARYINGAAFKSQDFSKDKTGLPIVKIVELKNGITDSTAFSKKVVDSKYYIDDGDILFSWSGSPETSIDVFLWSSGKAILNQHSFNVKVDDDNEKAWVYFLLKYKKSLFIHLAKMKQTTGLGHVTISDLKENHFATPPKDDRKRFGKVFNGFLQKIMTNQSQIQSLTKTRDTLLPKLMSGRVRVKNIKHTADA